MFGILLRAGPCAEDGSDEFSKSLLAWAVSLAAWPSSSAMRTSFPRPRRLSAVSSPASASRCRSARSARSPIPETLVIACETASSRSRSTCSNTSNHDLRIFAAARSWARSSRCSPLALASYPRRIDSIRALGSAQAPPGSSSSMRLACALTLSLSAKASSKSAPMAMALAAQRGDLCLQLGYARERLLV